MQMFMNTGAASPQMPTPIQNKGASSPKMMDVAGSEMLFLSTLNAVANNASNSISSHNSNKISKRGINFIPKCIDLRLWFKKPYSVMIAEPQESDETINKAVISGEFSSGNDGMPETKMPV